MADDIEAFNNGYVNVMYGNDLYYEGLILTPTETSSQPIQEEGRVYYDSDIKKLGISDGTDYEFTLTTNDILDEDDMVSDSSTKAPSQQSVVSFVNTTIDNRNTIEGFYILTGAQGRTTWADGDVFLGRVGATRFIIGVVADSSNLTMSTDWDDRDKVHIWYNSRYWLL